MSAGRSEKVYDHIWVTSRGLREYREYFALSDADLQRSILDCPAGAASFVAEVTALGGTAVAADLVYGLPLDELTDQARSDLAETTAVHRDNPDLLGDGIYADTDELVAVRSAALELFISDREANPARYVSAALPVLPFADDSFDIVLSPYLLFCYGDRLGLDFHLASIREMLRVARSEVRLAPICDTVGTVAPWRESLFETLRKEGAEIEILTGINCTLHAATESVVVRNADARLSSR